MQTSEFNLMSGKVILGKIQVQAYKEIKQQYNFSPEADADWL